MMQDSGAPAQGAGPEAAPEAAENAIVDQIGVLLQKLSPEKQKELVDQLSKMMGDDESAEAAPAQGVDPNAGASGVPAMGRV